jgi:hypothetical protein
MIETLEERLSNKLETHEYSNLDASLHELLADEAKEWAIEIVSGLMLEECVCKNKDYRVDCYFCQIRDKLLKKLEEN